VILIGVQGLMTFGSTTYRQINGRGLAEAAILTSRGFLLLQISPFQELVFGQYLGLTRRTLFGYLEDLQDLVSERRFFLNCGTKINVTFFQRLMIFGSTTLHQISGRL